MPTRKLSVRLFVITALALLSVLTVGAQSGRKTRKPEPPPIASPTPGNTSQQVTKPTKPALTLIVGLERTIVHGAVALASTTAALNAMVDRFEDHPNVKVARVDGHMSRNDAVRRAKAEEEAYVVFMELDMDGMAGAAGGQLRLSFWVYSPVTANVKKSGQTYPQMYRTSSVILNPRTSGIYGDYQVQEAARDAAERILRAFNIPLKDKRPGLSLQL